MDSPVLGVWCPPEMLIVDSLCDQGTLLATSSFLVCGLGRVPHIHILPDIPWFVPPRVANVLVGECLSGRLSEWGK